MKKRYYIIILVWVVILASGAGNQNNSNQKVYVNPTDKSNFINYNTENNTYFITGPGMSFQETFDENDTAYTMYPGPIVMQKLDNNRIVGVPDGNVIFELRT